MMMIPSERNEALFCLYPDPRLQSHREGLTETNTMQRVERL